MLVGLVADSAIDETEPGLPSGTAGDIIKAIFWSVAATNAKFCEQLLDV
jgi:hypothetical protein